MEARLNRSQGPFSSGTRVLVVEDYSDAVTDDNEYDNIGYVTVELLSPPYTTFDVPEDDVTECRPTREMVPKENRHKRREKKRNEYELLQKLGV